MCKKNIEKSLRSHSCATFYTHPPPYIHSLNNNIYIIYILLLHLRILPPPLSKRLRNYATFDLEHIFTTVKTKKNFLRGDNLKIC